MGKRGANNPNLAVVRHVVRGLGGTIVQVTSGRHLRVTIRTKSGGIFTMGVSQGRVDPYKQAGWVRQHYNKAKRKAGPASSQTVQ